MGIAVGVGVMVGSGKTFPGPSNDWYDPDFKQMYAVDSETNITPAGIDFAFLSPNNIFNSVYGGYNCVRLISPNTVVNNLVPAWSKSYFDSLQYNTGDRLKFGFWVCFPDASPSAVRRIYYGGGGTYETSVEITDSSWHWFETLQDFTVTDDTWQKIYIGPRYAETGESVFVRGLTLTNLKKTEWRGELKSNRQKRALAAPFKNQNAYVEKIFQDCPLITGTKEQNGLAYSFDIIQVSDFGIEGVRFSASATGQFRLNLDTGKIPLSEVDNYHLPLDSGYLKYGLWVKCNTVLDSGGLSVFQSGAEMVTDKYLYRKLESGIWHWVELPAVKLQEGLKEYRNPTCQLNGTPLNVGDLVEFEVCGLTVGFLSEPLTFRYTSNNIGIGSPYYNNPYGSYGDSITAANGYQQWVKSLFGAYESVRGIGGTTVANNQSTAWVDAAGNYLGRLPDDPPPGVEGVDYFTIEASMCRQQRADTIPVDSKLLTIMGGINDWAQDIIIGDPSDSASDEAGAGFYASYRSMLDKLARRAPVADIYILNITYRSGETVSPNANGNYLEDFRIAIRDIAQQYGFPVIETNDVGINDTNWSEYSIDAVHPNSKGYELIGRKIAESIINY